MLFAKERERVRNATRVIRALMVRPGSELQLGGAFANVNGGLQALAQIALAPLRMVPDVAARVPGTLRELGERVASIPGGRRRAPAVAFAAQALAGSVRHTATMRERYLNLLAASMDGARADRVHPAFLGVLRELTSDEVRIVSLFQHDGPYPVVTIQARHKFGGAVGTELRNFSLLGEAAGCEHPERTPLYIDNLCRLGVTELRPTRVADDTRVFRTVEERPEVAAAMARIAGRTPGLDGAPDTVVADLQRKGLYVTAFGRQFYEACEYRPEPAR
jgi:Abortive infection alpha